MDSINIAWMLLPWVPAVVSLILLWSGQSMGSTDLLIALATIAAALIAGAITLIVDCRESKRNGKTIDRIDSTTMDVKPKVESIEKLSQKQSEQINSLISDLEHRRRMEAQYPQEMSGKDMMMLGVNKLLEQYDKVSNQYQKAQEQIASLKIENSKLRNQNQQLKAELQCSRKHFREKSDIER